MKELKQDVRVCEICGKQVKAHEFLFKGIAISGICILINNSGMEHIKIKRQQVYDTIPLEDKQSFLDNFRKGKTVGESYILAGLTQEEGFAIMDLNIEKTYYLRQEPK